MIKIIMSKNVIRNNWKNYPYGDIIVSKKTYSNLTNELDDKI